MRGKAISFLKTGLIRSERANQGNALTTIARRLKEELQLTSFARDSVKLVGFLKFAGKHHKLKRKTGVFNRFPALTASHSLPDKLCCKASVTNRIVDAIPDSPSNSTHHILAIARLPWHIHRSPPCAKPTQTAPSQKRYNDSQK